MGFRPARAARALLALLLLVAGGLAQAQDSLETTQRAELERVRRAAAEKRAAASRLKGQETQALGQLRRTERELNQTRRRLRTLQNRHSSLDTQLRSTRVDLERSIVALNDRRARLAKRLRNLYKRGPARDLEFLLSPRSFAQLLARWDFLVMVAEQDRVLMEDVKSRKQQVEVTEGRLETNLTEIQRTSKRTTAENDRLATLRRARATSVSQIKTQRESYEEAAAELERTARAIQSLLARLERQRREESDKAKSQGRVPQPYTGNFAQGQGRLPWPVRGSVVGRFGPETHPKWGTTTLNNGIDIEAPVGTAVRAVAKGRVDYTSEDFSMYGKIIVVNHGDGYYTLYGHLSDIMTSVGQEVASGQTIARSGDTGSLKGPILHFEVRKGASSLNPQSWLE